MVTTRKEKEDRLIDLTYNLSRLTGIPANKLQAVEKGRNEYIKIDYNPAYGGYRICCISLPGYSTDSFLTISNDFERLPYAAFERFLCGLIIGLSHKN